MGTIGFKEAGYYEPRERLVLTEEPMGTICFKVAVTERPWTRLVLSAPPLATIGFEHVDKANEHEHEIYITNARPPFSSQCLISSWRLRVDESCSQTQRRSSRTVWTPRAAVSNALKWCRPHMPFSTLPFEWLPGVFVDSTEAMPTTFVSSFFGNRQAELRPSW